MFRCTTRIVLLTIGFLFAAGFCAGSATLARQDWGLATGLAVLAGLFCVFALRFPFTRAVATDEGLTVHSAVANRTHRWDTIASVSAGTVELDGSFISVRAPILHLTDGTKVTVSPAACYSSAKAVRMAAELESLRRAHASP